MTTVSRRTLLACALAAALAAFAPPAQAQVTYEVTFQGNWTTDSVPGGVISSAHFTTLVGAVHNDNVTFWESGGTATSGVEGVAELGATGTFAIEVNAAASNASLVRQSIGGSPTVTHTFDVNFTAARPLFTLLSMIGPSPDWFVGVSSLSLLDDQDQWLSSLSMDLFAYDAGTENGTGFSLQNSATVPQGTITSLKGVAPFSDQHPMARLSFARKNANVPPAFGAPTSFSVQENGVTVGAVEATDSNDEDSVTGYAIASGSDGALFSITPQGALSFRVAPNYEDPQDANADNLYEVVVRATSGAGDRALSATATISVTVTDEDGEAPSAPAAPTVTALSWSSALAAWTAPSNAGPDINDYDYRYREQGGSAWTEVTNTTISGLSATISGLSGNTAYEVQVLARNAEGASAWSASGTGSTEALTLGQVTGVSVTPQALQLAVSWNALADATGYKVQWKSGAQAYDENLRQGVVGAATAHTISSLAAGVEYTVRVIGTREHTPDGPPSEEATGMPLASPEVSFAASSQRAGEAAGMRNVMVNIDPAPSEDITIRYALSGAATLDADYAIPGATGASRTLDVSSGTSRAMIAVAIMEDNVTEGDEAVVLTLSSGAGYRTGSPDAHALTITDNDAPDLAVSTMALTVNEGGVAGMYTIALATNPGGAVTVTPSSSDAGAATVSAALAFDAANWQTPQTVEITPQDDIDAEDETVVISHAVAGYGALTMGPEVMVAVDDDEVPATAGVDASALTLSLVEGGAGGTYTVALRTNPGATVTVTPASSDAGAASVSGALRFDAANWGTPQTITVTPERDADTDNETVTISHSVSGYAGVSSGPTVMVTVTDNDEPTAATSFASAASSAGEAAGVVQAMMNLSPAPRSDLTIRYALSGTATLGEDYTLAGAAGASGTLAVASGSSSAMISITIADDAADEEDETVILTIQSGTGYAVGGASVHTLTITDDDDSPTAIESVDGEFPAAFALEQNYPNPFNPETTIRYGLPRAEAVRLAVYDVAGQEVAVLVDQTQPAGRHEVRFGAGPLPSGLYLYRLQAGSETRTRAMLLVK